MFRHERQPVLTGSGLDIELLARVARGGDGVSLSAEARARVAAARAVVERAAAGEQPIYGLNTGLGGNLKHRLAPEEITAFQTQFVVGRAIGVGRAAAAHHRARDDAGARQRDDAGRGGRVAGGARSAGRAHQPRRDTGRAALGLDRCRRPRVARAHRARDHRARIRGARGPRAPGRRGAAGGGSCAGDAGSEGRACACATATRSPPGWPGSRCTMRDACCGRPSAPRHCRSKAMPPTPRYSTRASPPPTPRSARSPPRSGSARSSPGRRCTSRARRGRSRMR